jgi:2-phospho-L-lactate guanylyltransferase (CobY/MobA/RfbA family)
MDILEKIFIDFQNLNATRQLRAATKTASIESIFDSFLLGLDQRIEDVTAALPNQTTLKWK